MSDNNSILDYDPHDKEKFVINNGIKQQHHKLGTAVIRFVLTSAIVASVAFLLLGAHIYNNLSQTFYIKVAGEYSPIYFYIVILLWFATMSLLLAVGRYGSLLREFAAEGTEKDLKEVLEQKMLIFVVGSLIQFAMVALVAFLMFAV